MESNRARDRENVTKKILKNSGSASARADTKATHQWLHPLPPSRPPARLPSHHPIKSSTRNGKISWRISTSIQSSIPAGSPIQRVLGTESWKLLQRCPADPGRIQHPESATSDSGGGNRFHRPITAPRLDCINQSQQQYSN